MSYAYDGGTKYFTWQQLTDFLAAVLGSPSIQTQINSTQSGMSTVDALAQALSAVPPCPGSNL